MKTALITGGSSGIGKQFAQIHAEKGGDLVLVARNEKALFDIKRSLESKYKIKVFVIAQDLVKPNAVQAIYDEVKTQNINIDYLINNAGFGGIGKFHERDWQKDHDMILLNVVALTALTRLVLPDFVARNEGRILNVSSTASLMAGPLQAVYFATKAYVTSFSNAIAEELRDTNITVTNLMPGATETNFGKVSGMEKTEMFKSTANARQVAEDGYHGMMDGTLDVISGLTFSQKAMLSMVPLLPKKMILSQVRKMQEVDG